jgi:hypothetical protein
MKFTLQLGNIFTIPQSVATPNQKPCFLRGVLIAARGIWRLGLSMPKGLPSMDLCL